MKPQTILSTGKTQCICRTQWRFTERCLLVMIHVSLLVLQTNCQTILKDETSQLSNSLTKTQISNVDVKLVESNHCHSCHSSNSDKDNKNAKNNEHDLMEDVIDTVSLITERYLGKNRSELQKNVEDLVDGVLNRERYQIIDGVEINLIEDKGKSNVSRNNDKEMSRALFGAYTYEYRILKKVKDFVDTHILSINLPKAARFMGFRSFGLKKFLLPLFIGAQVFKSILLAMFLPSILGSFGKILGKGISTLSATSSQASYPPMAPVEEQEGFNNDNKDYMGYESDPNGAYSYPQDVNSLYANMGDNENDIGNVDLSRYGPGGQKVTYLPTKTGYYKNQMQSASSNNYKVFQKIPASSMILSNYDPFYSPLLSRLDGIFARLGLAPSENEVDATKVGQAGDAKMEACREQLVCLMYSSPAKYAPYSNLVSAQLSRELNELRRPVSDNPEILRFFRYMRAARRGQEGADCERVHPGCSAQAAPQHTMIAAYHDINKLVTARKLH